MKETFPSFYVPEDKREIEVFTKKRLEETAESVAKYILALDSFENKLEKMGYIYLYHKLTEEIINKLKSNDFREDKEQDAYSIGNISFKYGATYTEYDYSESQEWQRLQKMKKELDLKIKLLEKELRESGKAPKIQKIGWKVTIN